jgi:hypothetical protein
MVTERRFESEGQLHQWLHHPATSTTAAQR